MPECECEHRRRPLAVARLAKNGADAAERKQLERDRCRGVRLLERLAERALASPALPSASAAKPIRQSAAVMPQRWLTSLNAS